MIFDDVLKRYSELVSESQKTEIKGILDDTPVFEAMLDDKGNYSIDDREIAKRVAVKEDDLEKVGYINKHLDLDKAEHRALEKKLEWGEVSIRDAYMHLMYGEEIPEDDED